MTVPTATCALTCGSLLSCPLGKYIGVIPALCARSLVLEANEPEQAGSGKKAA